MTTKIGEPPANLWLSLKSGGFQRWWQESAPPDAFWLVASATFLFNFGVSVFFFLYNLLMLNLGFRERSLGVFAGTVALGSVVGTIPMGILAERIGLKKVLATCLVLLGAAFGARAYLVWSPAQITFSFVVGVVLCGWTVCLSPVVAWLVEERKRPFAFSVLFAVAVAGGSLGGFVGGNMPLWCQEIGQSCAGMSVTDTDAKRITILIGCAVIAVAAWPVTLLSKETRPRAATWLRRPSPSLIRILVAIACWGAALGIFNPFSNVFFSRYLGVMTAQLGNFFALAQLIQAGAVLLTPLVVRGAGLIRGILIMQLVTAAALGGLSRGHGLLQAELFFCVFMAAQHMCEPVIQSLLMGRVAENLRSEAAAMSLLVLSIAQATAATAGGIAFARFQHSQVIAGVAFLAAGAALLFHWLCGEQTSGAGEGLETPKS